MTLPWFLEAGSLDKAVATFTGERSVPVLAFDLETTNLDKGWAGNAQNRIVCASWIWRDPATGTAEQWSQYGDEFSQNDLARYIQHIAYVGGLLVAHNGKFEAGWVTRLGVDAGSVMWWDTMLAEYVVAGNRRVPLALDAVAQRYGCSAKDPLIDRQLKNGVCPSLMDEIGLMARNRKDTADTFHIWEHQMAEMTHAQKRVLFTRGLSVPVLADIEQQGVQVDGAEVEAAISASEAELRDLLRELEVFTQQNLEGAQYPEWWKWPLNLSASDQVAWILYKVLGVKELKGARGTPRRNKPSKRWPDGKPLANDKALTQLKLEHENQRQFLRLRKGIARVRSELSKTLYFFRGVVSEYGGVFYGQYNQSVTQTHRLSSSGRKLRMPDGKERGVQLQNMPRKYKKLLKTDASCDAAQLEFRVAVELGNDTEGRDQIARGVDRHKVTAAAMFNTEYDAVLPEQRQAAKPETFKPLYGGRRGTPQQEAYYAAFRKMFPGISGTQEGWTEQVLQTGRLTLPWGMTFYWPGTKISRDGYIDNTPSIYNYPVQSLATAEIVPIATAYLWHRVRALANSGIVLVNLVHDSVDARLEADDWLDWERLATQAFGEDVYTYLYAVYGMQWGTPLGLGVVLGGKETTYTLDIRRAI